jgi:hypothetical protein
VRKKELKAAKKAKENDETKDKKQEKKTIMTRGRERGRQRMCRRTCSLWDLSLKKGIIASPWGWLSMRRDLYVTGTPP